MSNETALRIRENQALIQKVLRYWFGQFTPDQSQKKLWMIAAQSVEHRRQVDAEIGNEFVSLLLELSLVPLHGDTSNDAAAGQCDGDRLRQLRDG